MKLFCLNEWTVESNYVPLMGMKMVKGRNFSPDLASDSSCVLINETAARLLGYADKSYQQGSLSS